MNVLAEVAEPFYLTDVRQHREISPVKRGSYIPECLEDEALETFLGRVFILTDS